MRVITRLCDIRMITTSQIAKTCHCTRIRAAARTMTRIYDEAMRPTGLKGNQLTMLVATDLMQPVSITALSDQLSMERTTLTRNLTPLQKDGLISIQSGKGRTREISLTPKGHKRIEQAKPLWKNAQDQIEKLLGKEKAKSLDTTLEEVALR